MINGRVTAMKATGRCLVVAIETEEAGAYYEQIFRELAVDDDVDIVMTIRKRQEDVESGD